MQEGVAYNEMGRYAEAVDALKRSDQNNPWVHVNLVYAYSELGREQDARAEAAEVLRISPGFSLEEVERIPENWQGSFRTTVPFRPAQGGAEMSGPFLLSPT